MTLSSSYITFSEGQLCNQLYYILQSYIHGFNYVFTEGNHYHSTLRNIIDLGLEDMVTIGVKPDITICSHMMDARSDFCSKDMYDFIRERVLTSRLMISALRRFEGSYRSVAVHVRNTDYLNNERMFFDRNAYYSDAFSRLEDSIDRLVVFTDDVEFTKNKHGDLFSSRFNSVSYTERVNDSEDLLLLALHRNKILLNSTYSYWSARIGDALYGEDGTNVIVPNVGTVVGEPYEMHATGKWNAIDVR